MNICCSRAATRALIFSIWAANVPAASNSQPESHALFDKNNGPSKCSWYVSPEGNDDNDGASLNSPLQSVNDAVERLQAGDTLCLLPGTYRAPIVINDKKASQDNPIILMPYAGVAGDVFVEDGPASLTTGVNVTGSSHVHISGLTISRVLRGIQFNSVTGGRIAGNVVRDIQQEGIRVGALQGNQGLTGNPSSNVVIADNVIEDTGLRPGRNAQGYEYNEFGEGIYVGTGRFTGDATHDILIDGNIVRNTTADSIEVKPYTRNITVSNNTVSGSRLKYAGAISIAIGPKALEDGNYLISNNRVYDVRSRKDTVAGIVVGQGNVTIKGNIVWDIEGGRGIRVYTTFVLPDANTVRIENNIVWNPLWPNASIAIHDGAGGFELNSRASVTSSGNVTDDGSGSSSIANESMFVGPLHGNADKGSGPGSGFRLRP